ncbi:2-dehydropantoate 2-reductase [Thalassobacillus sp. B23F22_16]|uniref:2-dehydropantoate 2-reductase n=1 Tax=Thalassobacillus sp. B23F22_16 TaxID=3459513 RepID=UPI00373F5BD0
MEIGIIGGGATGMLLAHYLGESHQVTLYVRRKDQAASIESNGIQLEGTSIATIIRVRQIEEGIRNHAVLFVCVKQHHLDSLIPVLNEMDDSITVIFLQNGMAHIEKAKELSANVMVGVIEHGALKVSDHTVRHTGRGIIRVASLTGSMDSGSLVERLHQEDFPFVLEQDYYPMLAKKLIINAVINPLTALLEIRNGQLLDNPYLTKLARQLCREACNVLALDENEEWANVERIARSTAKNYSSMYKDLSAGRITEINAITGYLLKKSPGQIPAHSFIYQAINAKQFEKRKEEEDE